MRHEPTETGNVGDHSRDAVRQGQGDLVSLGRDLGVRQKTSRTLQKCESASGAALEVTRSAIRSCSAQRRRPSSSRRWSAIRNSASIPASSTRRAASRKVATPRVGTSELIVPITGMRGIALVRATSPGISMPARDHADEVLGNAHPGDQVVAQLLTTSRQVSEHHDRLSRGGPGARNSSTVSDVRDLPGLRDRQADGASSASVTWMRSGRRRPLQRHAVQHET